MMSRSASIPHSPGPFLVILLPIAPSPDCKMPLRRLPRSTPPYARFHILPNEIENRPWRFLRKLGFRGLNDRAAQIADSADRRDDEFASRRGSRAHNSPLRQELPLGSNNRRRWIPARHPREFLSSMARSASDDNWRWRGNGTRYCAWH